MAKASIGFIALIAILALTSAFSLNLFLHERTMQDKVDINVFSHKIGEWRGKDIPMKEEDYKILETRNLILREYNNPSGDKLVLYITYSETNRAVFHPPEVCLIGEDIKIFDKKSEKIGEGKKAFYANKLYIGKDNFKELMLYCYKAGSLYTDNFYLQQAYLALQQIFGRRVPGATIRVSMPLRGDEKATLATLKSFLAQTVKTVDSLARQ